MGLSWPKPNPMHILRVGIGITFLWIGVLILQDPIAWSGFIRPWVRDFLILPVEQTMQLTGVYDLVVGALLIFSVRRWMVWLGALLGSAHMIVVLAVAGIDPVTVRDIAVLAGALSLLSWAWPSSVWPRKQSSNKVKQL